MRKNKELPKKYNCPDCGMDFSSVVWSFRYKKYKCRKCLDKEDGSLKI